MYTWKNGMNLSANKQESLENKILSKLDIINDFKNHGLPTLDFFLDEFKEVSFVWKIFLLCNIGFVIDHRFIRHQKTNDKSRPSF